MMALRGSLRQSPATRPRPSRRATIVPHALYHNKGPRENPRATGAQKALSSVLNLVQERNHDALVDYFATENLAGTPTLRLAGNEEVIVFEDVMEGMLLRTPNRHFLDSYAIRHLIMSSPASTQVLSGLLLGPHKYVQRMVCTSPSGEAAVLTFTLTATDAAPAAASNASPSAPPQAQLPEPGTAAAAIATSSTPADQPATLSAPVAGAPGPSAASSPGSGSGSSSGAEGPAQGGEPEPVWRLRSVVGEPAHSGVTPSGPSPELSPEQIVEAQLEALQCRDFGTAYRLLSPDSRKLVGSLEKFQENISKHRRYGALLGHLAVVHVRRCMARPTVYLEIVSVTSASGTRFVFCYILSQESKGPQAGCWSIEFVKVVDDPRLLQAVELSTTRRAKEDKDE